MKIVFELDDHEDEDEITPIDTAAALIKCGQFADGQLEQIANHILIAIGMDVNIVTNKDW